MVKLSVYTTMSTLCFNWMLRSDRAHISILYYRDDTHEIMSSEVLYDTRYDYGFTPGMVTMFAALFVPEGADIAIHPANAPCMLAVAEAAAAAAGGAPAALVVEVPTSGSVKEDQPPPIPACPFRCCFELVAVSRK